MMDRKATASGTCPRLVAASLALAMAACSRMPEPRVVVWGEASCKAVAAQCETAYSCAKALLDLRSPPLLKSEIPALLSSKPRELSKAPPCGVRIRHALASPDEATIRGPLREALDSPVEEVHSVALVSLLMSRPESLERVLDILPRATAQSVAIEILSEKQAICGGSDTAPHSWCELLKSSDPPLGRFKARHGIDWNLARPAPVELKTAIDEASRMNLLPILATGEPPGRSVSWLASAPRWSVDFSARDWRRVLLEILVRAYTIGNSDDDLRLAKRHWSGVVAGTARLVEERALAADAHDANQSQLENGHQADIVLRALMKAWAEHGVSSASFARAKGSMSHGFPDCSLGRIPGDLRARYRSRTYVVTDPDLVHPTDAISQKPSPLPNEPIVAKDAWQRAFRGEGESIIPWRPHWSVKIADTWILNDTSLPNHCPAYHCGPSSGPRGMLVVPPNRPVSWISADRCVDRLDRATAIPMDEDVFFAPLGTFRGELLVVKFRAKHIPEDPLPSVSEGSTAPRQNGDSNRYTPFGDQSWVMQGGSIVRVHTDEPAWLETIAELPGAPLAAALTDDQQVVALTVEGGVLVDPSDGHVRMLPCR